MTTIRLWPRALLGRVALIVCGALALTHALTVLIILRERSDQGMAMMLAYVGRDVASAVAILDRVPAAERAQWLPRLARQNYRYALDQPHGTPSEHAVATPLARVIAAELGAERVGTPLTAPPEAGADHAGHLLLPLRLADGSPVALDLTPLRPQVSSTTLWLLGLQLLTLGVAVWFCVRLAVRPLSRLAEAADALRPGEALTPLPEQGPREVAAAARAFNAMQGRIDVHLKERMHLLAAISHDLQTPITRLRLRGEQIDDAPLRAKVMADLDGMQALVEEGLAYARTAQAAQEPARAVDLHALLDGLVCDATDAGHTVHLAAPSALTVTTRVNALRRLLGNLLDNALKFAGTAHVVVTQSRDHLDISVLDDGPGIPESQLQAVLQPFVRLESSRNRDTGGTGLGLAIAQQLSLALQGELRLANRAEGGLQATLRLPVGSSRSASVAPSASA
jgi:signal transduction histidine kinase